MYGQSSQNTYAWFTTQAQVTANTGVLTVNSPATLKIKGAVVRGGALSGDTTDLNVVGVGGNLGAVSSVDGKMFYAPTALEETVAGYAGATYEAIGPTTSGNGFVDYLQYNLAVTAAKGQAGKTLQYSIAVDGTNADANLLKWYRVAIYTVSVIPNAPTDATAALTGVQDIGGDNVVYSKDGDTDSAYYDTGSSITTKSNSTTAIADANDVDIADSFVTSLTNNVTAHFTIAVWMEGTAAATTQNVAAGKSIKVTFTFALV